MPLDLPDGVSCFVDSNILYYALVPTPTLTEPCLEFISRVVAGKITMTVSIPVLSDVLHKVMIAEAAQIAKRDRAGMIGFLGRNSEIIAQLVEYPKASERLAMLPKRILSLDETTLQETSALAVRYRLMTNDAIIVALMQRNGIEHLVSNDDDFAAIPGIRQWKPR